MQFSRSKISKIQHPQILLKVDPYMLSNWTIDINLLIDLIDLAFEPLINSINYVLDSFYDDKMCKTMFGITAIQA